MSTDQSFSRILNSLPELAWSAHPDGTSEFFCWLWFEYTGLTAEQSEGWAWTTAIHPDDRDQFIATWRRVLANGVSDGAAARIRRNDGVFRWFLIRALPLRDDHGRIIRWYCSNTDIDERKRTEETLRRIEERFRLAAQAGRMFAYEWDAATDVIVRSEESVNILGIPETDVVTGQQVLAKVHPDDRDRLLAAMARLRPEEPDLQVSYRMVRPDNAVIWVERNSRAYFDDQSKILRINGMVADVTERKRAEEELRRRDAALAESQRLARIGSWQWDTETDTVTWSTELYRLLGLDPQLPAISYQEHGRLFVPESWERLQKAVEEALRHGTPYELDLEVIRIDGARLWVVTRGEVQRDTSGRVVGLRGTVQDFTERKQIEQALRESEERFRVVSNSVPVLIWMSGLDKMRNYFNQPWLDFTGRTIEDELGIGWVEVIHPEDKAKYLETYYASFDQRQLFKVEYRLRRHDGEYRWVLDTGVPRFETDGSFAGYIGSALDVTERKKSEEALASVSGRLIEAQEKERRRIARELHDDINQRLALLAIELQALAKISQNFPERCRGKAEELSRNAAGIATDIQSLSHTLHSSKLEILGIAAAIKGFCSEFAAQQKVQIDFGYNNIPDSIPQETSLCLFRILQEGLTNAVRHSGVDHFDARLTGLHGEVELTVRDSGKGFDPGAAESNQGLGLVSMRERVGLVNGTISIISKPMHGTEIRVRIPVAVGSTNQMATSA